MECIHLLRRVLPKAQISVEIEKPGRHGLVELASEADVVFYSKTWAEVVPDHLTIPYEQGGPPLMRSAPPF